MRGTLSGTFKGLILLLTAALAVWVVAAHADGGVTFSNTVLMLTRGSSEPEIAFDDGFIAVTALSWNAPYGTQLWTGNFGSTPPALAHQGTIDTGLAKAGFATVFGGGDASIAFDSSGNLLATTTVAAVNKPFTHAQYSISAIRCRDATSANFTTGDCKGQIIDAAGNDRPWIATDGSTAYIVYHDGANAGLIRVQRSDNDGRTWKRVGDVLTGAGRTTGNSTFHNLLGPLATDPVNHDVYEIFVSGQTGIEKAKTIDWNNVYVAHSSDHGMSWTPVKVYAGPPLSTNGNVFPDVAVDPTSGDVYAVWSNASTSRTKVYFSYSTDDGATWSTPVVVNSGSANTALFPWVAAYSGVVDVAYYGTDGTNNSSAVWNTYLAQTTNDGSTFTQYTVSNGSNYKGVICTLGTACAPGTRNLLDFFEVGIDPTSERAAVVYVYDPNNNSLPQTKIAYQLPPP